MPKDRARARHACRIADVDPDRFNEMVAAEQYPCAPRTIPGAARIFDVNDIVTLIVFRHLTEEGVTISKAGLLACGLRELLHQYPDANQVVHVKTEMGLSQWMPTNEFDPLAEVSPFWGNMKPSVVSSRVWQLRLMRERILYELNEEDRIAGEE